MTNSHLAPITYRRSADGLYTATVEGSTYTVARIRTRDGDLWHVEGFGHESTTRDRAVRIAHSDRRLTPAARRQVAPLSAAAQAAVAHNAARHERDSKIVAAVAAGASFREVAAATGVSHETVRKLYMDSAEFTAALRAEFSR